MAQEEQPNQPNQRGFRVNDRRRFSPETGEPRVSQVPVSQDVQDARDAQDVQDAQDAQDVQEQTSSPETEPQPSGKEQPHPPATPHTAPRPELSFSSFILGLSTQAMMYMGEIAAPGQPPLTDLSAAQEMIDIISLLQLKTAGNLDSGEEAMVENVLFDLRMRYVEIARSGHSSDSTGGQS